jgi:hypothetical protein
MNSVLQVDQFEELATRWQHTFPNMISADATIGMSMFNELGGTITEEIWLLQAIPHRNHRGREGSQHNCRRVHPRGREFVLWMAVVTSRISRWLTVRLTKLALTMALMDIVSAYLNDCNGRVVSG